MIRRFVSGVCQGARNALVHLKADLGQTTSPANQTAIRIVGDPLPRDGVPRKPRYFSSRCALRAVSSESRRGPRAPRPSHNLDLCGVRWRAFPRRPLLAAAFPRRSLPAAAFPRPPFPRPPSPRRGGFPWLAGEARWRRRETSGATGRPASGRPALPFHRTSPSPPAPRHEPFPP